MMNKIIKYFALKTFEINSTSSLLGSRFYNSYHNQFTQNWSKKNYQTISQIDLAKR